MVKEDMNEEDTEFVDDSEGEDVQEGMDEDDLEDEDLEMLETEKKAGGKVNKLKSKIGKVPAAGKRLPQLPQSQHSKYTSAEDASEQQMEQQGRQPKDKYVVFSQPARLGIADGETGDIIGEGDAVVIQALANIITRLERIETSIGSMLEE